MFFWVENIHFGKKVEDKISSLNKPFEFEEILSRLIAQTSWPGSPTNQSNSIFIAT